METVQQYNIRVKKEKDDVQIKNDNARVKVLRQHLIDELNKEAKIDIKTVEEYNSITKLPF